MVDTIWAGPLQLVHLKQVKHALAGPRIQRLPVGARVHVDVKIGRPEARLVVVLRRVVDPAERDHGEVGLAHEALADVLDAVV